MKLKVFTVFAAACLLAVPAVAALRVQVTDGPWGADGGGSGGLFTVTVVEGSLPESPFHTFCVELNEYFTLGGTYYAEISDSAMGGGAGGGSPDPLSAEGAALYTKWFTEASPSDVLANTYQLAIWSAESEVEYDNARWEVSGTDTAILADYQAIAQSDVQALINDVGGVLGGIGSVRVLRLWANPDLTGAAQDMLVRIPAPGAALLGVIGLGTIGWVRRRLS